MAAINFQQALTEVKRDLSDLKKDVDKHDEDLYKGKDKDNPSLTTRMSLQEEKVEKLEKAINKTFWTSIATLLAIIADLVSRGIFK